MQSVKKMLPNNRRRNIRRNIVISESKNIPRRPKNKNVVQLLYSSFTGYQENTFVVLTCSYNKNLYIPDWINSIIAQQYRPLNVVFVDDCSSSSVDVDIVMASKDKFADQDIGLRVIKNSTRCHCGTAYRLAHDYAMGDFFGVVDADDMLLANAVESVCGVYKSIDFIAFVYTQFQICDSGMNVLKPGFCTCPPAGKTLLDLGMSRIHAFSHWRTFSNRLPRPKKIWKEGLTCAVDKYMGYRLEEMGSGVFLNKICYSYRQGIRSSISHVEKTKANWSQIKTEAQDRRRKYNLPCFSIREVPGR